MNKLITVVVLFCFQIKSLSKSGMYERAPIIKTNKRNT